MHTPSKLCPNRFKIKRQRKRDNEMYRRGCRDTAAYSLLAFVGFVLLAIFCARR